VKFIIVYINKIGSPPLLPFQLHVEVARRVRDLLPRLRNNRELLDQLTGLRRVLHLYHFKNTHIQTLRQSLPSIHLVHTVANDDKIGN